MEEQASGSVIKQDRVKRIQERAEFRYLAGQLEDTELNDPSYLTAEDGDLHIEFQTPGLGRGLDGEKGVMISAPEPDIDQLQQLDDMDYEFSVHIDSPDKISASLDADSEHIRDRAEQTAREETSASGYEFSTEFEGGYMEVNPDSTLYDGTRVGVTAYNKDNRETVDRILDVLDAE